MVLLSAATKFLDVIAPKKATKAAGAANTPTFDPTSKTGVLTVPRYMEHLSDIFDSRLADDSRTLIKQLMISDPEVSAAFNGYLTLANTEPVILARAFDGTIDRTYTQMAYDTLTAITTQLDYTLGFQIRPSMEALSADLRTMLLMRGTCMGELVFDKKGAPSELRLIDPVSINWVEKAPNQYKPFQKVSGKSADVSLDYPTIFWSTFRRDPTGLHTHSPFTAAINTLAARQQICNDLYRVMKITGFPRMHIRVVEEILLKSVPGNIAQDPNKVREWVNERLGEIAGKFANLRADQAFISSDSVEASLLNENNPAAALDITNVIEVLNAQNSAGLRSMPTLLGRGGSGVNTASVEARIAALNADELNNPVADFWSDLLSFYVRLNGFQGVVEVKYRKCEMRPETELQSQLTMKAARLLQDLSLGVISDEEYALEMWGRLPLESQPPLSGTGFMAPQNASVDATNVTPNADPLGRSVASPNSKSAKSNTVKKPTSKPKAK